MKKSARKKDRSLERDLMRSLVDPHDSDQRKRYIKRWIYGENKTSERKVNSFVNPIMDSQRLSIWQFLHRIITGDDE